MTERNWSGVSRVAGAAVPIPALLTRMSTLPNSAMAASTRAWQSSTFATSVCTEIARRPRTEYVAQLVGLNLYRGRADGTTVALDTGGTLTIANPTTGNVYVAFPPSAISLYPEPPIGTR